MSTWLRLAVGCVLLLGVTLTMSRLAHLHSGRQQLLAGGRALVQLAVVAAALRGVFAVPGTAAIVVTVMFSVAAFTATRRLDGFGRPWRQVVVACAVGSAFVIGVIVGLPALDRTLRSLVAVSGIIIGGTMTAATLSGRHLLSGMRSRRDEIEAWLALGATPRQAYADVVRRAAAEALIPGMDQTRTVGLVTLPGAFVGALLGGASPVAAARFQLVVLIGLMCAQVLTAAILTWLLGAPDRLPAAERESATAQ